MGLFLVLELNLLSNILDHRWNSIFKLVSHYEYAPNFLWS